METRSVVDCSVLDKIMFGSLVKESPLGKKLLVRGLSDRGTTDFARNKGHFENAFMEDASREDQVCSGPGCWEFVGFELGQKSILGFKGLRLCQFVPKPKSKETMKSYAVTGLGLVLDPEAGFESAKGLQRPKTMSAVVQSRGFGSEKSSTTRSEKSEEFGVPPACLVNVTSTGFVVSSSDPEGFACLAVESVSLSAGPGQVGTAGASLSALVQDADLELESSSQSALPEMVPSQVEVPQAWKAGSGSAFSGDSSRAAMLGVRLRLSLPVMSEAGAALHPPESKPVLRYSRKLKDAKLIDLIAESVAATTISPSLLVEVMASPVVSTPAVGGSLFTSVQSVGVKSLGFEPSVIVFDGYDPASFDGVVAGKPVISSRGNVGVCCTTSAGFCRSGRYREG